jgi:isopenicillin N synthase-like dioxygenase
VRRTAGDVYSNDTSYRYKVDSYCVHIFLHLDLSDWFKDHQEGKNRIVAEWYKAFTTCGFAIIVGHGVPTESTDIVYDLAQKYFHQPLDEKMKNCLNLGMF